MSNDFNRHNREMLRWMGYNTATDHRLLKKRYLELLTGHFCANDNYMHLTASKMKKFHETPMGLIEMNERALSNT